MDFLVASKPGQLPFSEMTRLLFHFFESIFYSLQASKYLPHLPITDAAERFESQVKSAGDQSANLFQKTIPDHPLAAQIDQVIQLGTFPQQTYFEDVKWIFLKPMFLVPFAQRPTRELIDL